MCSEINHNFSFYFFMQVKRNHTLDQKHCPCVISTMLESVWTHTSDKKIRSVYHEYDHRPLDDTKSYYQLIFKMIISEIWKKPSYKRKRKFGLEDWQKEA